MRIPRPRDSAGGETGGRVAKVVADADVKRAFERGRSACSLASRSGRIGRVLIGSQVEDQWNTQRSESGSPLGDVSAAPAHARHANPQTTMRYDDNRQDLAGRVAEKLATVLVVSRDPQ